MPDRPLTGRSLVTRRAVVDIVRGAVLGSYGVTGVDAGPLERLLGRLGLREPGIRVRLARGIQVDLHLTVGYGVPVAEVARQVDSAVRYAIRHALELEVQGLSVHVGGLRYQPASVPPAPAGPSEAGPADVGGDAGTGPARDGHGPDGDDASAPADPTLAGPGATGARVAAGPSGRRRGRGPHTNGRDPG